MSERVRLKQFGSLVFKWRQSKRLVEDKEGLDQLGCRRPANQNKSFKTQSSKPSKLELNTFMVPVTKEKANFQGILGTLEKIKMRNGKNNPEVYHASQNFIPLAFLKNSGYKNNLNCVSVCL